MDSKTLYKIYLISCLILSIRSTGISEINHMNPLSVSDCLSLCYQDPQCSKTWIWIKNDTCYMKIPPVNNTRDYSLFNWNQHLTIANCSEFVFNKSLSILTGRISNHECSMGFSAGKTNALEATFFSPHFIPTVNIQYTFVTHKNGVHNYSIILLPGNSTNSNLSLRTDSYMILHIKNKLNYAMFLRGSTKILKEGKSLLSIQNETASDQTSQMYLRDPKTKASHHEDTTAIYLTSDMIHSKRFNKDLRLSQTIQSSSPSRLDHSTFSAQTREMHTTPWLPGTNTSHHENTSTINSTSAMINSTRLRKSLSLSQTIQSSSASRLDHSTFLDQTNEMHTTSRLLETNTSHHENTTAMYLTNGMINSTIHTSPTSRSYNSTFIRERSSNVTNKQISSQPVWRIPVIVTCVVAGTLALTGMIGTVYILKMKTKMKIRAEKSEEHNASVQQSSNTAAD